ncbi:YD repeat-containing protein [Treponema pedis str. T A4]|uniref:YD repeat-containing protein n=1 Tax=Treponema pedis str. T A4 TaxID=1291379 RepID=S6A8M7_9SPIR|nr:RHS repeat-associated core domain-containing protein [Treponema pedis]AGT44099.1 YD repeat-containing protein [Treponema pedis str. T A4]
MLTILKFLYTKKIDVRFTGKELDEETGLYYYGARYLDPKYSRWLSGDPALNDYIPKAPVNDEAKKHYENLPGMGGLFNVVNLHVYHYAGNNPVKYIDPDGRENYDASITKEQYDKSWMLQREYTWEQLQDFFKEHPDTILHRYEDEVSFRKLSSRSEIVDPNSANMILMDAILIGKNLFKLTKLITTKLLAKQAAKKITEEVVVVGGREYSKYALERMAERNIVPMVVEETIKNGIKSNGSKPGTFVYLTKEAKVVVNEVGKVITVMKK